MFKHSILGAALCWAALTTAIASDDSFTDEQLGFSISKPAAWVFLEEEDVQSRSERLQLSEAAQRALFLQRPRMPLVSIAQQVDSDATQGIVPSVTVVRAEIGGYDGFPASIVMTHSHAKWRVAGQPFKYLTAPRDKSFHGHPAAYSEMSLIVRDASGRDFDVRTRNWLIPRQGYALMIGMSASEDEAEEADEVFDEILETIELF